MPGWSDVGQIVVAAVLIYLLLIGGSRIIEPRSFSEMAAIDFVVTVAIDTIIGSTATGGMPLYGGAIGVLSLLVVRSRRCGTPPWSRPVLRQPADPGHGRA